MRTGKVTDGQVRRAVRLQEELAGGLAEAAMLAGHINTEDLGKVKAHQRRTGAFFERAVIELGMMSEDALGSLKDHRGEESIPLGEALVLQGAIAESELAEILAEFERYKEL
ncbi:MAG TPA: hypothetical protein VFG83_14275 [Kofleriaceae bacterium]|nr:hypothetical protein [Kofleriaceae bacterium]